MLLVILFILTSSGYAEENRKISIAIMEFRANNTKDGFGKACMDMLSEKLFASELFILMEKTQMDRIARQNGFREFNTADPEQTSKLGRKLNVDKMLAGSITYLDSYIIDVKILNAATGEIEFNVRKKISSIEKLDDGLDDVALSIERYCLGYYRLSGIFDVSVEMHYVSPFGAFGRGVDPGPGIQCAAVFNDPFEISCNIQVMTGFYSFRPVYESLNYYYMVPLILSVSYKIILAGNIKIFPSAGAGYVFSRISSDDHTGNDRIFWGDNNNYYNPAIVIRSEFDILLFDRWYLMCTPQYNIFFEEDRAGQFASLGLGLKMLF